MARKQKFIDFDDDNEAKKKESYLGLANKSKLKRSLENFQAIKEQHQEYLRQHGRTWLKG